MSIRRIELPGIIPTKIVIKGDMVKGKEFIKFAKNQLDILEHQMNIPKVPLNEGSRTVKPFEGVVIEAWSSFTSREIVIHVAKEQGGGARRRYARVRKGCHCFPHFSFGIVTQVSPVDPTTEWLLYGRYQYTIDICTASSYVIFEGSYDANFGRYYLGQYVMVSIAAEMDEWDVPLDCNRVCLVDNPRFTELTISPIHIIGGMEKWIS